MITERQKFLYLNLFALLICALGFFLYYGRQAQLSGSWKYVISHDDEYGYWAYAKGASEEPPSDGNPFYYEEMGTRHPVPFPTVDLIGWLSKTLKVPVLFFFPIWHIGMPYITWLTLFLCLHKLWGYSLKASAVASAMILISTLYLRGQASYILHRFSRPGDTLWLVIIWASLIMNLDRLRLSKTIFLTIVFISTISFWMHPFLTPLGMMIMCLETLWQYWVNRNKRFIPLTVCSLSSVLVSAFLVFHSLSRATHGSLWPHFLSGKPVWAFSFQPSCVTASVLYLGIVTLVFMAQLLRESQNKRKREINSSLTHFFKMLSKLDRLILFVFLIEPVAASAYLFPGVNEVLNDHVGDHRYTYLLIEIGCLSGWLIEKTKILLQVKGNAKLEYSLVVFSFATALVFLSSERLSFLHMGIRSRLARFDNATLLFGIIALLFLGIWLFLRFHFLRNAFKNTHLILAAISLIAVLGFSILPHQLTLKNEQFPFDGAYRWLNQYAARNEVVLTASSFYAPSDFLTLYTNLKCYTSYFGTQHSNSPLLVNYRNVLNLFLLGGFLDERDLAGQKSMPEKLTALKLDYILIPKWSPFIKAIKEQLDPYLAEVYQDDKCLLWRVDAEAETGK